jgi:hypothetical protein
VPLRLAIDTGHQKILELSLACIRTWILTGFVRGTASEYRESHSQQVVEVLLDLLESSNQKKNVDVHLSVIQVSALCFNITSLLLPLIDSGISISIF